jgi:hypothetical protein
MNFTANVLVLCVFGTYTYDSYFQVIDGVMRQLLSKDLMYEPAKQICDKFPEWLAIHK